MPLSTLGHGQSAWTAGLIVARQRPGSVKGFAFFVLGDRHSRLQLIISSKLWEEHLHLLRCASALIVYGEVRVNGRAITLRAERLAGLGMAVFDDEDSAEVRTVKLVLGSFNRYRS